MMKHVSKCFQNESSSSCKKQEVSAYFSVLVCFPLDVCKQAASGHDPLSQQPSIYLLIPSFTKICYLVIYLTITKSQTVLVAGKHGHG